MCSRKFFRMPSLVIFGVILTIVLVCITGITLTNSINISNIVKLREKVASDSAAANGGAQGAAQTRAALVEQQYAALQQHHLSRSDLNYITATQQKNVENLHHNQQQQQQQQERHNYHQYEQQKQSLAPTQQRYYQQQKQQHHQQKQKLARQENKIVIEIDIRNLTQQQQQHQHIASSTVTNDIQMTSKNASLSVPVSVSATVNAPITSAIVSGNIDSISVPAVITTEAAAGKAAAAITSMNTAAQLNATTTTSSLLSRIVKSTRDFDYVGTATSTAATTPIKPTTMAKSFFKNSSKTTEFSETELQKNTTYATLATLTNTPAPLVPSPQLSIADHNPAMIDFERRKHIKQIFCLVLSVGTY